jgi:tetratricopeptide (TPR) repeat protein
MVSLSRHISLVSATGLALLCLVLPGWAADGRIQAIQYDAMSRHFQIKTAGSVKAVVNTLNIAGHKRIIIDLDNTEIGNELPRDVQLLHALSRQIPALKNVTVNQYAGNGRPIVRILMDIQGNPGTIRLVKNQGSQIELELNASASRVYNSYAQPPSLSRLNTPSEASPPRNPQTESQPPVYEQNSFSNDDLRRSLSILNSKYENLAQQNQLLKNQLNNTEQAQNGHLSTLQRNRDEQNRLKADLDRLSNDNAYLQSQLNSLRQNMQRPDAALASQQTEISRLKGENQSLSRQLAAALSTPKQPPIQETSINQMKQTLVEMNRRYERLAQENQGLKSKLATQSDQTVTLSAIQAERDQLNQENQILTADISRLKTDLQKSASTVKNTASVSDSEFQTLRKQLTVAQVSLSESIRTINEQNKEIAYLRNQVNTVQAGMDGASKEQVTALQTEVSQLKKSAQAAEALKKELASTQNQLESLKKMTASAKNSNASKTEAVIKPDLAQQKTIDDLTQQLAALREANKGLKDSLSAMPVHQKTSSNTEAEQDYNAAKAALNEKKIEVALSRFKEALLLDADNAKYATDYSIALAEDRQYAEAIDVLRRYLQRNPGDRDAYNQLGKVYLLNDQPDAANQAFTRAIPLSVLNNYATSLKKVGNTAQAESVFKLALTINPKDSEVLFNLGNLYNAENKLQEARNKYLEAIQARPGFAEAHYNLGLIFSKLGDNAQAVTHLEKYLQLSPNARNAETIRTYMQKLKA